MKEKDPSKVSWKQMFMFTRNGNPQSQDLMVSFFLGIGLLFVHFIIGNRLTILFENLLPDASRGLKNLLGILVPALLCALIAFLIFRVIGKKKVVLTAYCVALIVALVFVVVIAFSYDKETVSELLLPFLGIFVIPGAAGTLSTLLLYRRWSRQNPDPIRDEEMELAGRE